MKPPPDDSQQANSDLRHTNKNKYFFTCEDKKMIRRPVRKNEPYIRYLNLLASFVTVTYAVHDALHEIAKVLDYF